MNETLKKQVDEVIREKIAPALEAHNGGIMVKGFEDGVLTVRLMGQCTRCASANDTLNDFIKIELMEAIPEVTDVVLDESVPEDMLAMARKILNHEI